MATPQQPASSPNPLAMCVPALARAGQILCAVSTPAQAREALRQAAAVLDSKGRLAGVATVKDLADKFRAAADSVGESDLVPTCRQMAASTAREVTALAKEIQLQARGQVRPVAPAAPVQAQTPPAAPAPPRPPAVEAQPVEPARPAAKPTVPPAERARAAQVTKPTEMPAPVSKPQPPRKPEPAAKTPPTPKAAPAPAPQERARPAEKPQPAEKPKAPARPEPAERARVPASMVERLTIARTPAEQSAVTNALQEGRRFAVLADGAVIDTKTNRMWSARVSPPVSYGAAQGRLRELRLGGYGDWRLPTPDELKHLLAGEGQEFARASGLLTAGPDHPVVEHLWTSQSRLRFWLFGREATCLAVHTGGFRAWKAGAPGIGYLAVRSAAEGH